MSTTKTKRVIALGRQERKELLDRGLGIIYSQPTPVGAMILVLAASQRHYEFHKRFFWTTEGTRFVCPQHEDHLLGLRPSAVIELEDWWRGKSEQFLDRVKILKEQLKARPA